MRDAGTEPPTGSVPSPWDDAAVESPMGPIKAGCAHARTFEARERASPGILECIGAFCSGVGIRSAPGSLGPAESGARHRGGRRPECGVGV